MLSWALLLDKKPAVACQHVLKRMRGQPVDVLMIEKVDAAPWVKPMITLVGRDQQMFGCTNVLRVAGLLAIKEGCAPGQEAIESVLEASHLFRWLDKETGWFTLGETDGCSIATRVRKIMSVTHDHLGTDEITAALASDDMMMYRETQTLGLALPPIHVLRELFRSWPWLRVVQKGRFMPAAPIAQDVLSEPERLAVQVIEAHDGVACRFEIRDVLQAQLKVTNMLVSVVLGSSPVFDRVEHGLYRVIGRRVGDTAVKRARDRASARGSHPAQPGDATGPSVFWLTVTEASARNEQYHVPRRYLDALADKQLPLYALDGAQIGLARVTQSGALSGINVPLRACVGDRLEIRVGDDHLVVCLVERAAVTGSRDAQARSG
jgi:hypothetical protein